MEHLKTAAIGLLKHFSQKIELKFTIHKII